MTKYIHYCWFGGKPLSKLAKKCIKSWQKYLPDYKIILWNEENCDLNECQFVKQAYEDKKWAFVADYFRIKALNEYGGIYFDTDMEIVKPIDALLKNDTFLGVEDSGCVAVGVWYEKEKNSLLTKILLEKYHNVEYDKNDIFKISIPKIITEELIKLGYKGRINEIEEIKNIVIYPREYFYPLSYDRQNNIFTDNTCMVHYYDATWVPKWEKRDIRLIRIFGRERAIKIINIIGKIKLIIKKILKFILWPLLKIRRIIHEKKHIKTKQTTFINSLKYIKENKEIVIHNPDWLGTSNATKEIFKNTLPIGELIEKDNYEFYAKNILNKKPSLIIFSAFAKGWKELIEEIYKIDNKVTIKVLWHGSNAVHIEDYDFKMFKNIFELLESEKIYSIGFVKESMYQLYKKLGYNVEFLLNTVKINKEEIKISENKTKQVKIGLYASGDRWVKNYYNQLAGASLIKNSIIDIVPLSERTKDFAKILKANIKGESNNVEHNIMLEKLAKNDINVYATFVDCAPILPLESLELGVPCITGNNHHYWKNTKLEEYLIVDEVDNALSIAEKIEYCLQNKETIINLYKEWKKDYDKRSKKSYEDFIKTVKF